ncbi:MULTISPECIES: M20 family metallopeptidase [Nocardiaceae]|uniref:Acetylornithine deacetylase n=1 Tax=Rhodococcoides corynebacterioides TaxID=53972 RepID=A0ABS2KVN5_9NOCA|nr:MULTISPECIES: M20/M25/M40 family metallo-hydrolase [Rhodococcus]MBM7415321.1 acetylornithine deacetylase [Rhodococcus corynebacterioides]MBP1117783.1 acetylornithine deacetylase [Rhodococcus sp. PvP016]
MTAADLEQDRASTDVQTVEQITRALIDAGPDESAVVAEICRIAESLGLQTVVTDASPGRPNVEVVLPGGPGPGLLFLGHSDVVPAGEGWTGDPFRSRVHDGRIVGRGACDMKGGLAAVLAAMGSLARRGVVPARTVTLACVVDEEDTGLGIRAWVSDQTGRPPAFTVDDDQPPAFTVDDGRPPAFTGCVVAEPTAGTVIVGCRGAANIVLTVTGRSAHAGRPENGRSAVVAAARVVGEIAGLHAELATVPHPVLGAASWNVGRIDGGTGPSIVAGRCRLEIDRRVLPDDDVDTVVEDLLRRARLVTDLDVDAYVEMEMPGFLTEESSPLVESALAALRSEGAPDPSTAVWTASCDGGFVARDLGVSTIVLGPGDLEAQAHQPDESVDLLEVARLSRAYARLMTEQRP